MWVAYDNLEKYTQIQIHCPYVYIIMLALPPFGISSIFFFIHFSNFVHISIEHNSIHIHVTHIISQLFIPSNYLIGVVYVQVRFMSTHLYME